MKKKIVALLEEAPFVGDIHHKVSAACQDSASQASAQVEDGWAANWREPGFVLFDAENSDTASLSIDPEIGIAGSCLVQHEADLGWSGRLYSGNKAFAAGRIEEQTPFLYLLVEDSPHGHC